MLNALTIDVEDYFQVTAFDGVVRRDEWASFPLRVVDNTLRVLDLCDEFAVQGTFFILGWVAQREQGLVKEIRKRGHDVACHGFGHELIYRIGPERFREDVRKSKRSLEDICGKSVIGYRAPSYSITQRSLWALDILVEEGFTFDSSIFPVQHDIYGIPGSERFPYEIKTQSGTIMEFPLSTLPLNVGKWRYNLPIAGGGYLRLLPAQLVGQAIQYVNTSEKQPTILYFHPWEIDPGQPRIRAGLKSRFRHYLNLERMELKLRYLLDRFDFSTIQNALG